MNQQMQTTEENTTKNFYLGGFNIGLDPDDQMELNKALAKNTSDLAKGSVQLGAESIGFANAMIDAPLNQGTRDSDYYGPIDGFNRIFSNKVSKFFSKFTLIFINILFDDCFNFLFFKT